MNNKKKLRKRRLAIIITAIILVFSALSLIFSRTSSGVENFIQESVSLVEYYVIKKPIEFVSDIFGEFNSLRTVYEENQYLKKKLDDYATLATINKVLRDELDQMKELTEIDYLPFEYVTKSAVVIEREVETWSNQLTINIGKNSGVKEDMAVVTSQGMIGTISSVSELTSKVTLLSSEHASSQIPVYVMNNGESVYGLLTGYDVSSQQYEVTLLSDIEKLAEDAEVYTSGLGGSGKAPKGILIGKAEKLTVKEDGLTMKLFVSPAADFADLNYVQVVAWEKDYEE